MNRSVLGKTLHDLRWQIFGYGMGLALMAALVVWIYPSYREQLAGFEVPEALQGLTGSLDYSTPAGFLSVEFVSWVPIITLIFAIMAGTSALAGEEANGTLDLVLSQPISRRRLAVTKIAGIAIATIALAALAALGWFISVPFVDIEIDLGDLVVVTMNLVPITLTFAFLATWLGAALSDRRSATAAVTGFAVVSYFVNYLARIVDVMEPLAWASPFNYYDTDALTSGLDIWRTVVLLALAAAFALATIVAFEKREIGVRANGGWLRGVFGLLRRHPAEETEAP